MAARRDDADLVAALRAAGIGGVDDSRLARSLYASDASLYRVAPRAVVTPREVGEIPAALEVCREFGVPLTMRGAGTSIAGNAVGPGVVVDAGRHLNRVLEIDPDAGTALVEPGVVQARLHAAAEPYGLRFGPDPSTRNRATIGGMIGNNACGSRALGYGRTSDNVLGLDVVAGTGTRLRLGAVPGALRADPPLDAIPGAPRAGAPLDVIPGGLRAEPPLDVIPGGLRAEPPLDRLQALVAGHLAVIRTEFGRFGRQVSGYSLEHLLPENRFDVTRALVGSEGTLAVTLAARLRLVREPEHRLLVVLGYGSMAEAADAVPAILRHGPVACEGLDDRITDVVRRRRGADAVPPLPRGAGWLLVELAGPDEAAPHAAARKLIADSAAVDSMVVGDPARAGALWRIREDGAGLAARPPGGEPAHAGWEDAAVPPERLGRYLREFEALLAEHDLAGIPYGHFGDGCVHIRIGFPLGRPGGTRAFRDFLHAAAALAAGHGGTMSGEHGDGRARGELLPYMYTPEALALCAAVKDLFDPDDLLNPGVIVRPAPVDADLRATRPLTGHRGFAFGDDGGDLSAAVHRCTGVGKCRADNTAAGGVMCPSYLATREEKDSTRGRARVLQDAVSGALGPDAWRSAALHEVLDLCLSCKGCASDCPTGVDMAAYKAEALYRRYRRRLRPRAHYALGGLPTLTRLLGRVPLMARTANAMMRSPALHPLLAWSAGIDRRRTLPAFATTTFRRRFAGHASPPGRNGDVILFVDTFTDAFAPDVGTATVAVLEDAGYRVAVTERPVCCGITWISTGRLDGARARLRRAVRTLLPHARRGALIVGMEPSCTGVLRSDAVELLRGPDADAAAEVAAATRTVAELLTDTARWTPPDLSGLAGVAQPHCHHHAVMGWDRDAALLERAGAGIRRLGGCCGLAGNFGVEAGHHDISLAVAEQQLLPAVRAAAPEHAILADGFSCRTQLAALTPHAGEHLAQLLARHLPT